jgi:hypothetical protein
VLRVAIKGTFVQMLATARFGFVVVVVVVVVVVTREVLEN